MGSGRFGQPLKIVAAFEQADDAVVGGFPGGIQQTPGRPVEILGHQIDLRQRIAVMGVETGGDQDEIRAEIIERRQDARLEGLAEMFAAGIGRKRCIDDIARTLSRS